MIQGLLNSTTVPLLEQVVRFSEQRQNLLAGNVANIDTPGYQQRDLPVEKFRQALKQAVADRQQAIQFPTTQSNSATPGEMADRHFPEELFQPEAAAAQNITFQDGNNRSVERSMMEMRKNAAMQRFAIQVISSQLNMLQSVISERA